MSAREFFPPSGGLLGVIERGERRRGAMSSTVDGHHGRISLRKDVRSGQLPSRRWMGWSATAAQPPSPLRAMPHHSPPNKPKTRSLTSPPRNQPASMRLHNSYDPPPHPKPKGQNLTPHAGKLGNGQRPAVHPPNRRPQPRPGSHQHPLQPQAVRSFPPLPLHTSCREDHKLTCSRPDSRA